jgi:hypothetical protein
MQRLYVTAWAIKVFVLATPQAGLRKDCQKALNFLVSVNLRGANVILPEYEGAIMFPVH